MPQTKLRIIYNVINNILCFILVLSSTWTNNSKPFQSYSVLNVFSDYTSLFLVFNSYIILILHANLKLLIISKEDIPKLNVVSIGLLQCIMYTIYYI